MKTLYFAANLDVKTTETEFRKDNPAEHKTIIYASLLMQTAETRETRLPL